MTDFSFIKDSISRSMVEDGYKAVSSVDGGWDFLKNFTPEENKGFMFSSNPILDSISNKMDSGHSGSSYGWTMRQLEYIAKNGMDMYKNLWLK